MTIILSYKSGAAHVMAGDLMVSSPTPLKDPIELPTRFKTLVTNHHLVGLEQKTIIVNPRLAVAWAGNRLAARSIVLELAKLPKEKYSGADVLQLIEASGLSLQELQDIGLLIWMVSNPRCPPVQLTVQDYNVKEVIFNETSKIKFIGSGDFHFFEQIGFSLQQYEDGNQLDEMGAALGAIIGRIAIALFHELTCDATHDLFYGGGFEVVFYDPTLGALRKLPLSFAVWGYDDDEIWLTSPVFQQVYDANGVLFLRRFVARDNTWHQTVFTIGNFFVDTRNVTFDPATPLSSEATVHYFVKKGSATFSNLFWRDPGNSMAMSLDSNGQIVTPFSKEFMDRFYKVTEEPTTLPTQQ
jgi:hypothetical protein